MGLFRSPPKASPAEIYVFPLVGIAIISLLDHSGSSVLLTPPLSICLLGILAFRLETRALVVWFVIIWLSVVLALVENPGGKAGAELNVQTIVVRSLGFIVAGSLAIALNKGRSSLRRNLYCLVEMLGSLPCAVVVSDHTGRVLFANKRALHTLGRPAEDVINLSYFTFFTSPERRGHDMEAFLRMSEETTSSETDITVNLHSGDSRVMAATQIPMTFLDQKCVVTVFDAEASKRQIADFIRASTAARSQKV